MKKKFHHNTTHTLARFYFDCSFTVATTHSEQRHIMFTGINSTSCTIMQRHAFDCKGMILLPYKNFCVESNLIEYYTGLNTVQEVKA